MRHEIDQYSNLLRDARKRMGLSQRELAQKTGVTQAHISRIERGHIDVRLTTLLDVARVLGLELMVLSKGDAHTVEVLLKSKGTAEPAEIKPAYHLGNGE